ncbi:hypothetical protein DICSQDRAFT_145566 [Dichomitus squalens LYAD-421 SS1]|uniref:uncharacterized protein n=1 Tax=Dichomitus squalens (strain LYAD-421) TaxID=732165 RepID=UPI0004412E12|nr:uncharacterized protein DICSQDRAFT_145566 [Dichomitus squalens LYAD-421 SS1]EJF63328.1 hypothetical protein DICSQDRAFT_145566 [Dichomitus squalens LYAD-421 SS1]
MGAWRPHSAYAVLVARAWSIHPAWYDKFPIPRAASRTSSERSATAVNGTHVYVANCGDSAVSSTYVRGKHLAGDAQHSLQGSPLFNICFSRAPSRCDLQKQRTYAITCVPLDTRRTIQRAVAQCLPDAPMGTARTNSEPFVWLEFVDENISLHPWTELIVQ